MTWYSTILFLHVLGTLVLFCALALEGLSLWHLRATAELAQVRMWANICARVAPLNIIAMPLLFLPGALLARETNVWTQGWLQVGLVATFLIAGMTAGITRPRTRAIRRACNEATANVTKALEARLRDPFLRASVQLRSALALGTVFLMVAKTNHLVALLVIGVAIISGLAASAIHRSLRSVAIPASSAGSGRSG